MASQQAQVTDTCGGLRFYLCPLRRQTLTPFRLPPVRALRWGPLGNALETALTRPGGVDPKLTVTLIRPNIRQTNLRLPEDRILVFLVYSPVRSSELTLTRGPNSGVPCVQLFNQEK